MGVDNQGTRGKRREMKPILMTHAKVRWSGQGNRIIEKEVGHFKPWKVVHYKPWKDVCFCF